MQKNNKKSDFCRHGRHSKVQRVKRWEFAVACSRMDAICQHK